MLHASGDAGGVLLAEAAEPLGGLEWQLAAGGKLSRTNGRERQPGRTDKFTAREGSFQRDVNERRCNRWGQNSSNAIKNVSYLCSLPQMSKGRLLQVFRNFCLNLEKMFPEKLAHGGPHKEH